MAKQTPKININARVRVRLTPFGKQVFAAFHTLNQSSYANPVAAPAVFEEQLYEVMRIFGSVLLIGSKPVFVNNDIELLE